MRCKSSTYTCYNIQVQVVNTYHNQGQGATQQNTGWLTIVGSPTTPVGRYNNIVEATGPQPGLPAAWSTGVFTSIFEFSLELGGRDSISVDGKVTSDESFVTQDLVSTNTRQVFAAVPGCACAKTQLTAGCACRHPLLRRTA